MVLYFIKINEFKIQLLKQSFHSAHQIIRKTKIQQYHNLDTNNTHPPHIQMIKKHLPTSIRTKSTIKGKTTSLSLKASIQTQKGLRNKILHKENRDTNIPFTRMHHHHHQVEADQLQLQAPLPACKIVVKNQKCKEFSCKMVSSESSLAQEHTDNGNGERIGQDLLLLCCHINLNFWRSQSRRLDKVQVRVTADNKIKFKQIKKSLQAHLCNITAQDIPCKLSGKVQERLLEVVVTLC